MVQAANVYLERRRRYRACGIAGAAYIPDTKPGIVFDAEGICSGCRAQASKHTIDWSAAPPRTEDALADRYRRRDGRHDCVIPSQRRQGFRMRRSISRKRSLVSIRYASAVHRKSRPKSVLRTCANLREQFRRGMWSHCMPDPDLAQAHAPRHAEECLAELGAGQADLFVAAEAGVAA